jgi:hypothetical protein
LYSTPIDARSSRLAIGVAVLAALAAALFAVLPNVTANASPAPVGKITKITKKDRQASYGIWSSSDVPATPNAGDADSISLGLLFSSETGGRLYGIKYYAAGANRVATTGHVWNADGDRIASVRFASTSTDGWKTAWLNAPARIRAGEKYTVSYQAPNGRYAVEQDVFGDGRTVSANGLTAHRGTYIHGPGRPTDTRHGENYFIDVAFAASTEPTTTTDTTTTTNTTPTSTQTGSGECVRPDAANTGATGTLTDYTGSTYITTPGTVIDGKTVHGDLVIAAANVVVRNSRVTGRIEFYPGGDDGLITGVTAKSGVGVSSAHRATIEKSEITNASGQDAMHVSSDRGTYINGVTVRDNWIHSPVVPQGAHYDGLQVRGAADVLVECNNFDLGAYQDGYNAPVFFEWDNGGWSNVRVVDNWLLGGAFNVMLSAADSDANRIVLNDNRVGGDWKWDLCMADGAMAKPREQTGNTLMSGDPVVPCP